ncbi:MAG: preprotein translocase subunit SecG [Deltaproteobacteria bacterium]|nr:preprotein translocase subunit SecG [Deltaproteobacteria bacterium]
MESSFLESSITVLHILVALILMISVLLQSSKSSGLGSAFGGSSSSVFGSRGPSTLISRVTAVSAVIFMVTSLVLALYAKGSSSESIITDQMQQGAPLAVAAESPQTPSDTTATEPTAAPLVVPPVQIPPDNTGAPEEGASPPAAGSDSESPAADSSSEAPAESASPAPEVTDAATPDPAPEATETTDSEAPASEESEASEASQEGAAGESAEGS